MNYEHIKGLRKNLTEPEKILWHYLRNRRFQNLKFRKQVPVDIYIVDFLCYEKRLIIELDGREHLTSESIAYDTERTKYLNNLGYKVVRFYNSDIFNNINLVLEEIKRKC